MLSSLPMAVLLTVLFVVTAGYALARWASLVAGAAGHPGDRVAELTHLTMSLAMIGMVWGYGGPVSNGAQLTVFTLLGLYFLVRVLASRRAGGGPGSSHCPAPLFHLLMCASMVWMVVAMPLLMPGQAGAGGVEMDGMVMESASSGPEAAPAWLSAIAGPVTLAVTVALLVAGGYWLRRALTDRAVNRPALVGAVAGGRPSPSPSPSEASAAPPSGIGRLTPRWDALCHLGMCLGMAVTFPLMR